MAFIEKRKRKFGDRKDGHWVKDAPGLNVIMACLFPKRTDSEVFFHHKIDVTELLKYIKEKNSQNPEYKITIFHCFLTMFARLCNERRKLNYFIQGARIYERDEIIIRFLAKRAFSDDAEEALLEYKAKGSDTVNDVSKKVIEDVKEIRSNTKADGLDETLNKLAKLPRLLLIFVARIVRWLDFWGKVPKSLTEGDTDYSTILVSNLGSIKLPYADHHLNNYGTNSIMITIGQIHKSQVVLPDGSVEIRDFIDLGTTVDERIADGFYFAQSFKLLNYLCQHPEFLDKPLEEESNYDYKS